MNQEPEHKPSIKVERPRIRDLGYSPGKFPPGPRNSILDVKGGCMSVLDAYNLEKHSTLTLSIGLHVGQTTIHRGADIHTGVTIIFPRDPEDIYLKPCYGATHNLNGVGELTGSHTLNEWGFLRSVRSPSSI